MIGVPSDSDQTIIAPLTGTLESASTGLARGKGRGRSQTPLILERLVSAAGRANVHLLAHLHVGATHRMPMFPPRRSRSSASSGMGNLPGILSGRPVAAARHTEQGHMRWPVPDCHLGEPATVDIEDHGCSGTAAGWLNQGSANRPAVLSFVAATARPGTQLTDPTVRLSAAAHPYLRPPSFATETEAGALPKAEFGWIGSNPDGRAEPPQTAIDTFTGEITAVDLLPGKRYYRAVGDGQYPNGAFWTEEPIGSEVALRRDYAVRNDWNGNRVW